MKNIFAITFLIYSFGCSSWDLKEVANNVNGNFRIKKEYPQCEAWRGIFDVATISASDLYIQSKKKSISCLKNEPDDSHMKSKQDADMLFDTFKKITDSESFEKYKFNNCFGSQAYEFFENTISQGLFEYYRSVYNCSTEINKKFKSSKRPTEYEAEVRKILDAEFKKFELLK